MYTRKNLIQDAKNFASVLEWKIANEAIKRDNVNDIINAIKKIQQKQLVVSDDSINEDYIALVREDGYVCI